VKWLLLEARPWNRQGAIVMLGTIALGMVPILIAASIVALVD
jgi:hypothetical protein